MPDRHPFVRASLQKAMRRLLTDRHGHAVAAEMLACKKCVARFWQALAWAAPRAWVGER